MDGSSLPSDAADRRASALASYAILETPPEDRFDRIARLTARLMDTPVALVTLADRDRMWVKARLGIEIESCPNELAFCPHALPLAEPLVVEDAALDPRFAGSPFVTEEPHVRFYAGAQLRDHDGVAFGALCVLDYRPRQPTAADLAALKDLAAGVVAELELRRASLRLAAALDEERALSRALEESRRRLDDFLAATSDVLWETGPDLRIRHGGGSGFLWEGMSRLIGSTLEEVTLAAAGPGPAAKMRAQTEMRRPFRRLEFAAHMSDGAPLWLEVSGQPVMDADGTFHGYRGVARDITARKLVEERNVRLADEDPLTCLPNRRVFERRLSASVGGEAQSALLMLDVDHFKRINDTYGHDVGDLLVQAVGRRIAAQIRQGDTVARIGGDEFAVILEAQGAQVREIAARICAAVAEPFVLPTCVVRISLSVGAVLTDDCDGDPATAVRLADDALYASKRAGRGRWTMHEAA